MSAQSVWAVTEGSHSDYIVLAIFEREQDANAAKDAGLGDDVTELPFLPAGAPISLVTVHAAWARAWRKGRLADVAIHTGSRREWNLGVNPAPKRPTVTLSPAADGSSIGVNVQCADADLALKALHDRLAQIYAEWEGV
jgi:hypothetical protein